MHRILTIIGLICIAIPAHAGASPEEIAYISCRACHADSAGETTIPAIAGRPEAELSAALSRIADEPDGSIIMHRFITGLGPEELDGLARYIAKLEGDER